MTNAPKAPGAASSSTSSSEPIAAEIRGILGRDGTWWQAYNANDTGKLLAHLASDALMYEALGKPSTPAEYASHAPAYAPVVFDVGRLDVLARFQWNGVQHVVISGDMKYEIPRFDASGSARFLNLWRREQGRLVMVTHLAQVEPDDDVTRAKYAPARDTIVKAADQPAGSRGKVQVDRDLPFFADGELRFIAGTLTEQRGEGAAARTVVTCLIALLRRGPRGWEPVESLAHEVGA